MNLENKTIIITGARSGIGATILFADNGAIERLRRKLVSELD